MVVVVVVVVQGAMYDQEKFLIKISLYLRKNKNETNKQKVVLVVVKIIH